MRQWMTLRFKLDGDEALSRALVNVGDRLKDYTEPLQESAKLVLRDIRINFDVEGRLATPGGWQKLADVTALGRQRAGFGAKHPILHRTGKYKRSFKGKITPKRLVIDAFGVKYHKYHQSSAPRTGNLPRRQTLFLRNEVKAEIVREFQEYVRFK